MDDSEIFNKVVEVLVDNFHIDGSTVTTDSNLVDDLGLDSVDIMDSLYFLEDKFGAKLLDEGPEASFSVKTIGDVVLHVRAKI